MPTDEPVIIELTPAQARIAYAALHSYLDTFGHDEHDVRVSIREVLAKLPSPAQAA